MRTFIFQGMCYSGKSTLGKNVADSLGMDFLDSRDQFVKAHGVSEIIYLKEHGREKFIEAEKKSLMDDFNGVFSCGGSAVYYDNIMKQLHNKYEIVWLDVDLKLIKKRKELEGRERPIVFPDGINTFDELYNQRSKLYKKYYTHRIKVTEFETIEETTKKILNSLVQNSKE
jgi:shikimate kinase